MSLTFIMILMLLSVSTIGLYLFIAHIKNKLFLTLFIPIVLSLIVTFMYTSETLKNNPIAGMPENAFMFLDYTTDRKNIHIWVRQLDKSSPTTHTLPYTRQKHEELEKAKEGMKKGKIYMGGRRLQGEGGGRRYPSDQESDAPFLYEFNITSTMPQKEGPSQ